MSYSEKIQSLLNDEGFISRLANCEDNADVSSIFAQHDVIVPEDEIENLTMALYSDNTIEMNEDELAMVSGGGAIPWKKMWKAFKKGWQAGSAFYDWEQKLYDKMSNR